MSSEKKYQFKNIPQFTRPANYSIHVSWKYLPNHLEICFNEKPKLDTDPDFQRAHVWTEQQQKRYVEFILRGGQSGKDIYTNCTGWMSSFEGPYVLVDGKQRLEAVRKFLRGDLAIFDDGFLGNKKPLTIDKFSDSVRAVDAHFIWHVNNLKTRAQVLQWYLDINSGGVVHTEDELEKVKKLLENEIDK